MEFTADEVEERRPLWSALSDLYLDTEPEWERVARVCAASRFGLPEIQRILFDEVHPVVHWNLWDTAGEWQGFNEEWLVQAILRRRPRPLFRLPWPEGRRYPWRQLQPYIVAARDGSGHAP